MNLRSFKLFHAVKGVGVASSWEKMGDALDIKMKLADVFRNDTEIDFFIELAIIAGSRRSFYHC